MGQLTVERLPVHEVCAGMPGRLGARLGQGRAAGWREPQPACGLPWEPKRPPRERRGVGRGVAWAEPTDGDSTAGRGEGRADLPGGRGWDNRHGWWPQLTFSPHWWQL